MERLVEQQQERSAQIDQIIANYKKDSEGRKNRVEYFEERLQRLEAAWQPFEETDTAIRNLKDVPTSHEYFTSGLYDTTKQNATNFRHHFQERIRSLGQPARSSEDGSVTSNPEPKARSAALPTTLKGAPYLSELTRLVRRHKALADSLSRLFDRLDHVEHPRQFYEMKLSSIKQYWAQLQEYHQEIYGLSDDPVASGYQLEVHIALETAMEEWLVYLSTKLDESNAATVPAAPTAANTNLSLPKISIPKFEGEYIKWRQFRDLFVQMVHDQPLSGCQKMWYLKMNLTGEAERLIRNFPLSEKNYLSAWKTLEDRYDNQRLIVAALVNKLMAQPSQTHDKSSASALKTLHDSTQECLMGLENLGISTSGWDPLLLHILTKRLDSVTHTLYEQSILNPKEIQSVAGFLAFLQNRFQALEALGSKAKSAGSTTNYGGSRLTAAISATPSCPICSKGHPLFHCANFLQMAPADRLKVVQRHKLCINCFRTGHTSGDCTLRGCKQCSKRHNSLLHFGKTNAAKYTAKPDKHGAPSASEAISAAAVAKEHEDRSLTLTAAGKPPKGGYVLLGTARVTVVNAVGDSLECRALLDPGSQINLVTDRVVKQLGLAPQRSVTFIERVGCSTERTQHRVNLELRSRINSYSARLEAYVLPQIVSPQPAHQIDISKWPIPSSITLADPLFNESGHIDMLLSAEHFYELLLVGQIKLKNGLPILQNTLLGWVATGKIADNPSSAATCGVLTEDQSLAKSIERFWKLEDADLPQKAMTPSEMACETHFCQTAKRDNEGRFVVRLPFAAEPTKLGSSRDIALRRFEALEKRLMKNAELRQQYQTFMQEYVELGHMEEVEEEAIQAPYYFLPHHCITKPDSSTTKLRVVFDASCKTASNVSLNDILYTGPTLQDDLVAILLRFRLPRFVFTADIEKMYRQVILHPDDRRYHMIFWRHEPSQPRRCYQLKTVTYGTTPASYLATKCLHRLAKEEAARYPLGAEILQRDFYVDDVMTGSNSLLKASQMQEEVTKLLQGAGFMLRKWCANHPRLLQGIPHEDKEVQLDFNNESEDYIKTLGLTWLPKPDNFRIRISWQQENKKVTKRTVASDIARMFDPLGIMGPVVVLAKIFLQQLWQLTLDWDAALPQEMYTRWTKFREELKILENMQFPRHVLANEAPNQIQLHVFTDASEKAYGAAIYVRSITTDGRIIVRLLTAKSRVAPLKKTSTPRLELCAAKLGADLAYRVKKDMQMKDITTFFWTDSEVGLGWINSTSSSYHTFVANRISAIQSLSIPQQWRHVMSSENPADILSRGIAPAKLGNCHLWFYGPPYLHGRESIWPPENVKASVCDMERKRSALTMIHPEEKPTHFVNEIQHGNSFKKLQRVTAYVIRFVNRLRSMGTIENRTKTPTSKELDDALVVIVKIMQSEEFSDEIRKLSSCKEINKRSPLTTLTPFLYDRGVLRVGGRLEASSMHYDAKHPILLPYKHPFTKILMTDIHHERLHLGPQALLATTRQRFWPIKGKTLARSVVQRCVRCSRAKPKMFSQLMGNLPSTRVQPARPFINAGVDFCGPISIHYRGRGSRPQKGYIAIFCCFATKAAHLEVVGDLTTESFIGSLKRFLGRRGHCKNLYCDNATNFVGAYNQLHELKGAIYSDKAKEKITTICASQRIDFHFIPPRAPHFGGLWEAAVKSAKHLLLRGASSAKLTHEELQTLIVEIEAILNSRPITPMSADPNDLAALTPGHFLIGEPLTSSIDTAAEPIKVGLLTRWKLVTHIKNEFWRRWTSEYLSELQHRLKWKCSSSNVQPGTVVIIKEDNTPVMKWPLGRIIKTYEGDDGHVRVADVKTSSGVLRRSIHRLAPLPIEKDDATAKEEEFPQPKPTRTKRTSSEGSSKAGTPEGTQGNEEPKKRARKQRGASLATLMLSCLILPLIHADPVEVTPMGPQPGLHFQSIGRTCLATSEWKLIIYYDLMPYWLELSNLRNGTSMLQHLCDRWTLKNSCHPVVTYFRNLQVELSTYSQLFRARKRRGALNIVGNLAKSLFGVLDDEYAQEMSKTITSVKGNQNQLLALLRNQTSIIDSTLNVIQKDELAAQRKFKMIDEELKRLANEVKDPSNENSQTSIASLFSTLAIQMTLMASDLKRTQDAIVDVISDTHHGKLSPLLLSRHQLKTELITIKTHLPAALRLPTERDDLLHLFNLITTKARVVGNHVIFELKLPLVSAATYDLYRLYSIPTLTEDKLMAFVPTSPYLVINQHRDQYYPLSEQEYGACTKIEQDLYLCEQVHPLYEKEANISCCEVSLLREQSLPPQCQLREIQASPFWVQLSFSNTWIYALKGRASISIVCGDYVATMNLAGSGLLKIQPDCTIKSGSITIQAHRVYASNKRVSFSRTPDLPRFIATKNTRAPSTLKPYQTSNTAIGQLKRQLHAQQIHLPSEIDAHNIHHYTIGYLSLAVAIALTIYLIAKCRAQSRNHVTIENRPRPRAHSLPGTQANG